MKKQVVVKENHVTQVVLKENQTEATLVMIRHQENHVIQVLVKENREATGKIIMIYF